MHPPKPAGTARFRVATTAALVCYWLAMFLGTHWPNFSLRGYPQDTDKVLHFSAYAGLSFLLALRLSLKRFGGSDDLLQSGATGEPLRLTSVPTDKAAIASPNREPARGSAELKRFDRDALRDGLWILAQIVGYSIFDEVTQIPVGRTCDFFDAVADWIGGVFGLCVFAVLHRALRRLAVGWNS